MYHKGDGVAPDIKKAIHFYEAAANHGDLQSIFNLGQIYRKGEGVRQDMKKAVHYYKIAAEVGHIPSVNEYGLLFAHAPRQ
jgi:TPR repeat protein